MNFFRNPLTTVFSIGLGLFLLFGMGAWLFRIGLEDLQRRFGAGDPEGTREASAGTNAKQRGTPPEPTLPVESDSPWVKALRIAEQDTRTALAELDQAIILWNEQVTALLQNEAGRRLGASPERCEEFAALSEAERPSRQDVELLRARLEEIVKQVDTALTAQRRTAASEALVNQAKQVAQETRSAVRIYRKHQAILEALVAAAKDQPPGTATLAEAVKEFHRAEAKVQAQRLAATRRKTQEQEKKPEVDEERARLEARYEAALPEIKSMLQPFISSGYAQPSGYSMVPGVKHGPVSWALIKTSGGLEKTTEGLSQLGRFGSSSAQNDRPKWSFDSGYGLRPQIQKHLQRVQDLLNEFGPLMVEKGLLAP